MTIFEEIRLKTKMVTEVATFVNIRYDKIDDYIQNLPIEQIENPPLDPDCHLLGKDYDTLLFFLTLEAINFGSGYFPHLKDNTATSGYFTIAKAWKNYFKQHTPISAIDLSQLTKEDCMKIFEQSDGQPLIVELMTFFSKALNQIGIFLLEKYNGQVKDLFEAADHSAEKLVNLLIQIPYFQDFATYGEWKVPLLKRAQITAADISLAFSNQGLGYFKDLDQLTIFADNMVPHVLRCDGILEYKNGLATRIDQQEIIAAGSKEEIEIRACAMHTVEVIRKKFQEIGHHFTSVDLDYLLWNRGLHPSYQKKHQLHLTRTVFY